MVITRLVPMASGWPGQSCARATVAAPNVTPTTALKIAALKIARTLAIYAVPACSIAANRGSLKVDHTHLVPEPRINGPGARQGLLIRQAICGLFLSLNHTPLICRVRNSRTGRGYEGRCGSPDTVGGTPAGDARIEGCERATRGSLPPVLLCADGARGGDAGLRRGRLCRDGAGGPAARRRASCRPRAGAR